MRKFLLLLISLVAVLLLGAPIIHAQEATAAPDAGWPVEERCKDTSEDTRSGTIAFISDQDGTQQIYVVDADGSNPQQISHLDNAWLSDLDWSPDGKQIAFTNNDNIYRLNTETEVAAQLTSQPGHNYHPAWSPDGQHIAYVSTRGGPYDIWLMKPNGANIRQMTYDPRMEMTVRWSPDSQSYGYVPNSGANLQIWIEGKTGTQIFMQNSADGALYNVTDFRWSPNGKFLSIQSNFGAYVVNTDETDLRQIADREKYAYDGAPSWSPDSCHLIFTLNEDDNSGIYIMDLYDGSTHVLNKGHDPVWKP